MSGWGYINRPSPTVCGVSSHAVGDSEWGGASVRNAMKEAADSGNPEVWIPNESETGRTRTGNVRVTTDEAAALQSYPSGFNWDAPITDKRGRETTVPKTKQYLQIGNAVPPLLAQRILEELWSE